MNKNLQNMQTATKIVELLSGHEFVQAKNILSLAALSIGLKLVPVSAQITTTTLSGVPDGRGASKPQKSVKESSLKKPESSFDKANPEWVALQDGIEKVSTQIRAMTAEERSSPTGEKLLQQRRDLVSETKTLKKTLQKAKLQEKSKLVPANSQTLGMIGAQKERKPPDPATSN
jgi:hypothetical protein